MTTARLTLCALILWCMVVQLRAQDAPPAPQPTVQLQVVLVDGSKINGTPVDFTTLPLKIEFARLDVPLHLIAQGAFASDRKAFVIKFRNNDTLTGSLELERIKVQTAYGTATIQASRIAVITVVVKTG